MKKISFKKVAIFVDYEVTNSTYKKVEQGSAELCLCDYCQNFITSRDAVYPKEITV